MSEQIDKLLVKAGAYFGGDGIDYSRFDPKRFAELIVKECASICYNSSMQDSDAHAQNLLYEFNVENCRSDK